MFKPIALGLIAAYQRHLSPRKGFGCPLRIEQGGPGCSGYSKRAIARAGFFKGVALTRRRFDCCALAADRARHERGSVKSQAMALSRQGGFADCACDAPSHCDAPSCDGFGGSSKPGCGFWASILECCSPDCSGCDSEKRTEAARRRREERALKRESRRARKEAQRRG